MNPQQDENFKQLVFNTKEKRTLANQTYDKSYYKNNFLPLLQLGQHYEKLAVNRIIKHFNLLNPMIEFNNDNKYDIKINNLTFEVKTDIKAVQTHNIFIEFISNNKPSGITTTKSNYYIIVIPYRVATYILIEVSKLEKLINDSEYTFILQPNTKNNFTGGYVFSVNLIFQHSIII